MVPSMPATEVIVKRFENPDEVREFAKGRFELVNIGGMTLGRAIYEPGWRWSVDRCRSERRSEVVQRRAPGARTRGIRNRCIRGWKSVGADSRNALSHSARTPRQLGRWQRALCLAPFSWCQPLCKMRRARRPARSREFPTI